MADVSSFRQDRAVHIRRRLCDDSAVPDGAGNELAVHDERGICKLRGACAGDAGTGRTECGHLYRLSMRSQKHRRSAGRRLRRADRHAGRDDAFAGRRHGDCVFHAGVQGQSGGEGDSFRHPSCNARTDCRRSDFLCGDIGFFCAAELFVDTGTAFRALLAGLSYLCGNAAAFTEVENQSSLDSDRLRHCELASVPVLKIVAQDCHGSPEPPEKQLSGNKACLKESG